MKKSPFPLHTAAHLGDKNGAKALVKKLGPNPTDDQGRTPLHYACVSSQLKMVEYLVTKCGANVNLCDKSGVTPVLLASSKGSFEVFHFLMVSHCSLVARDLSGNNVVHYLVSSKFFTTKQKEVGLHMLIERAVSIDLPNNNGDTPLHLACKASADSVVRILLEHKADPNAANKSGDTPVHVVSSVPGALACLLKLAATGTADMHRRNIFKMTPQDVAKSVGNLPVYQYLVKNYPLKGDAAGGESSLSPHEFRTYEQKQLGLGNRSSTVSQPQLTTVQGRGSLDRGVSAYPLRGELSQSTTSLSPGPHQLSRCQSDVHSISPASTGRGRVGSPAPLFPSANVPENLQTHSSSPVGNSSDYNKSENHHSSSYNDVIESRELANVHSKPSVGEYVRAMFAFTSPDPRCLAFGTGDIIEVIKQVNDKWGFGSLHGTNGIYPVAYVEPCKTEVATPPPAQYSAHNGGTVSSTGSFFANTNIEYDTHSNNHFSDMGGYSAPMMNDQQQNWGSGQYSSQTPEVGMSPMVDMSGWGNTQFTAPSSSSMAIPFYSSSSLSSSSSVSSTSHSVPQGNSDEVDLSALDKYSESVYSENTGLSFQEEMTASLARVGMGISVVEQEMCSHVAGQQQHQYQQNANLYTGASQGNLYGGYGNGKQMMEANIANRSSGVSGNRSNPSVYYSQSRYDTGGMGSPAPELQRDMSGLSLRPQESSRQNTTGVITSDQWQEGQVLEALYPYTGPPGKKALSFATGMEVIFLRKANADWSIGSLGGARGLFPNKFFKATGSIQRISMTSHSPPPGNRSAVTASPTPISQTTSVENVSKKGNYASSQQEPGLRDSSSSESAWTITNVSIKDGSANEEKGDNRNAKEEIAEDGENYSAEKIQYTGTKPRPQLDKGNPSATSLCKLSKGIRPKGQKTEQHPRQGRVLDSEENVKGGTVRSLVWSLFDYPKESERQWYLICFLNTYMSFTRPADVLLHMRTFYTRMETLLTPNDDTASLEVWRLRIAGFLKKWVQTCYHDMDDETIEGIDALARTEVVAKGGQGPAKALIGALDKMVGASARRKDSLRNFTVPPPDPIIPPRYSSCTFTDIDSLELARQICLHDFGLYSEIKARECVNQAWVRPMKELNAPNLLATIESFNYMSKLVATTILKETDLKKRVAVFERWIEVAAHLRQLNDFHGLMKVISGLNLSSIHRLSLTKGKLKKKSIALLDDLQQTMSTRKSYATYREALHKCSPPCVPYVGVFLTDLVFIEDGNKKFLLDDVVNFNKNRLVARVVQELQQYQQTAYNFVELGVVRIFIEKTDVWEETEQHKRSYEVEPRAPKP